MSITQKLLLGLALSLSLTACGGGKQPAFWNVTDSRFYKGTEGPYYFIGTNMWYGPLLASDTYAADPERLAAELDSLKAVGMTNLRVLVGADGSDGIYSKVEPTLQKAPGEYDENVFVGLDRFLVELGKRDMSAVLYLNNAWEWSGGFGQYLEWAGVGKALSTVDANWREYCERNSQFSTNARAKEMFADHVRTVVSRVNTVTGKPYSEDPAIFSWQICNEPRFFLARDEIREDFVQWLFSTAALIKSIDPNHMVSTGSEGSLGCEGEMDTFIRVHQCPDIDYLTMHIWPLNWSWVSKDSLGEDLQRAIDNTDEYIAAHIEAAETVGKPLVLEEFGFPRDGFAFAKGTPVTLRDRYYGNAFAHLLKSAQEGGVFSGINFWTFGGLAEQNPEHIMWQKGDDYCGDPAQEQQGLNSVYLSDRSTIDLIRDCCRRLGAEAGSLR
ncbi:MAG: beta-mannosidase [Bacteroidia bacterium]|nr:beta-mannosidase [Bacteroidia bacterium]